MVIFNSYVKLPEGKHHSHHSQVLDSDWHETSFVEIHSKNLNRSSKCSFEVPQMDGGLVSVMERTPWENDELWAHCDDFF